MIDIAHIAIAGVEGESYDQPCKFGCRVGGHAVYCMSERDDMPRKCRRTWYTGGRVRDEDCAGFEPNPEKEAEK